MMRSRLKLLSDYLARRSWASAMPIELVIEPTSRCNLHCVMCPRQQVDILTVDMSLELFKKIVDEAGSLELIDLSFRGEPLLHKDIVEMVKYAGSKGIRTYLSTNAVFLENEKAKELLSSGLDLLVISLDALTGDVYSQIRRGADFRRVVGNINAFLECKKASKVNMEVELQIIPLAENYHELQDFCRSWRRHSGVSAVRVKPFASQGGLVKNELYRSQSQSGRSKKHRCVRIWRGMAVYSDGTVVPCCYDFVCSYPLGSIKQESLKDIWNGPRMTALRKKHARGDYQGLNPCKNCENIRTAAFIQAATFIFNGLWLRLLLPYSALLYRINKIVTSKERRVL